MQSNTRVGILAPMPIEAKTLLAHRFRVGDTIELSPGVLLHVSGVGAESARKGAIHLLNQGSQRLVSWGVAGGIAPGIVSGHLIVPEYISNGKQIFYTDYAWSQQLKSWLPSELLINFGGLYQSEKIITAVNEKKALYLSDQVVAVDMESAAIAEVASHAQLPFIAIRAIVDSAHQSLPHWFNQTINTEGTIHPFKFALNFSRYPKTWKHLISLSKGFTEAQQTLKIVGAILNWTKQPVWESA